MKWVKASERLPELVQEVNAKYNERPISGQFLQPDKRYNVFFDDGNFFTIPKHLFGDLNWLDESESPAPDGWVRNDEIDRYIYEFLKDSEYRGDYEIRKYGGSLIIKFADGSKAKLSIGMWQPDEVVLDQFPPTP